MVGGQPLDHPPVVQRQGRAALAVTRQGEIRRFQVVAQLQQTLPHPALQFVRRQPVTGGVIHNTGQFRQLGRQVQNLVFTATATSSASVAPRVIGFCSTSIYLLPAQPGKEPTTLSPRPTPGYPALDWLRPF